MIGKFIAKLAFFVPIPLFVMGLNYTVDPSHIFIRGVYEKEIAAILLSDQNVADPGSHDERIVQKFYVKGLAGKKDIVVLGSSRSGFVSAKFFPGKTFFNSSVSAATLEDFMAIYGVYRNEKKLPANIYISLDPWVLDSKYPYNAYRNWDSLREDYSTIARIISPDSEKINDAVWNSLIAKQAKALVSIPYFVESFKYWLQRKQNKAFGTYTTESDNSLKLADGSVILDKKDRTKTLKQVNALATSLTIKGMKPFQIEPYRKNIFESFIRLMQGDGVKVTFYLPPYNPLTYALIRQSSNIDKIQEYFVRFAKENKIESIGSYNPADYGCEIGDFDDSSHPKLSCIKMTFEK